MIGTRKTVTRAFAAALAVALLCGCSGWEPIDYHETSAIPEGPGLISGTKGGWTIFRIEQKKKQPQAEKTTETDARNGAERASE